MNKREWMKVWKAERDEVAKSYDVEKFREFYNKWKVRGFYDLELPKDDKVIEITMRKIVYHLASSTDQEKEVAKKWLEERGCSTDLKER